MTTAQAIMKHLTALPAPAQQEVLDFVEFLESKNREQAGQKDESWSYLSLSAAMRGMEDEPSPYTVHDIKESYL